MNIKNLDVVNQITRIPNDVCPAFMEWCLRGGHEIKVKKDGVIIRKGKSSGMILCRGKVEPNYLMTEYVISRFELFSRQWMKYGRAFFEELDKSMLKKCDGIYKQAEIEKMRVAA
ncbi:hypothetical protein P255_01455 [Acinetobacter brisouii CIP 110357]|uniref:Uncharacterized protein n=1 Tax=Acinetobacter brisouii CIP 110357 TaxID=1341683 RepID=V2UQM5_9GAMM|nr:hypothetical protein [Acinetobacter brisouii]ENV48071.1 hypothetical protein F954_01138 [Acinetobacter brisouii ANC 4119]ESK50955.1 hypothetical protein P255_01455 [Acinetobacter brisouii CIP 110357]